ncbi:MAG: hypothetical protein BWK79_06580 [Beggiatoa sp. IS2]|nr:MAG: hypothetical protein BWK79_06580 [Beggiatoa sp. IS2]
MILDETVDWYAIAAHISETTGQYFEIQTHYSIDGSSISSVYRVEGTEQNYLVKINTTDRLDMFAAEADGLTELSQPLIIKVPAPLCWGTVGKHAYLVLQYLTLHGDTYVAGISLGQQLAALHQITQATFGWHRHNYIGLTPQINTLEDNWVKFWQMHRLGFQLALAAKNGYTGALQSQGECLLAEVGKFFSDYQPLPSLLHGDLWSGNYAIDTHGQPVVFDPAVYYGDRETDIAMTQLFGGFPQRFYDAYQERFPLDPGYSVRKILYNLYHTLNHLNIFGGTYLEQAQRMIAMLLSELH